jgi:hypothetical protein
MQFADDQSLTFADPEVDQLLRGPLEATVAELRSAAERVLRYRVEYASDPEAVAGCDVMLRYVNGLLADAEARLPRDRRPQRVVRGVRR